MEHVWGDRAFADAARRLALQDADGAAAVREGVACAAGPRKTRALLIACAALPVAAEKEMRDARGVGGGGVRDAQAHVSADGRQPFEPRRSSWRTRRYAELLERLRDSGALWTPEAGAARQRLQAVRDTTSAAPTPPGPSACGPRAARTAWSHHTQG